MERVTLFRSLTNVPNRACTSSLCLLVAITFWSVLEWQKAKARCCQRLQRRISIPADAEPQIVDVAFADLFVPELEGLNLEGVAGIDLPPFTGAVTVETEVEPELEMGDEADLSVEDPDQDAKPIEDEVQPLGAEDAAEAELSELDMDVERHGIVRVDGKLVRDSNWYVQQRAQMIRGWSMRANVSWWSVSPMA